MVPYSICRLSFLKPNQIRSLFGEITDRVSNRLDPDQRPSNSAFDLDSSCLQMLLGREWRDNDYKTSGVNIGGPRV